MPVPALGALAVAPWLKTLLATLIGTGGFYGAQKAMSAYGEGALEKDILKREGREASAGRKALAMVAEQEETDVGIRGVKRKGMPSDSFMRLLLAGPASGQGAGGGSFSPASPNGDMSARDEARYHLDALLGTPGMSEQLAMSSGSPYDPISDAYGF